ncbi:hypothetical protein GF327_08175 [Candidatus Woesearchaeota archaeon]|nr:hypothetical protein [Candidatus Woesearchaeota archaeon]
MEKRKYLLGWDFDKIKPEGFNNGDEILVKLEIAYWKDQETYNYFLYLINQGKKIGAEELISWHKQVFKIVIDIPEGEEKEENSGNMHFVKPRIEEILHLGIPFDFQLEFEDVDLEDVKVNNDLTLFLSKNSHTYELKNDNLEYHQSGKLLEIIGFKSHIKGNATIPFDDGVYNFISDEVDLYAELTINGKKFTASQTVGVKFPKPRIKRIKCEYIDKEGEKKEDTPRQILLDRKEKEVVFILECENIVKEHIDVLLKLKRTDRQEIFLQDLIKEINISEKDIVLKVNFKWDIIRPFISNLERYELWKLEFILKNDFEEFGEISESKFVRFVFPGHVKVELEDSRDFPGSHPIEIEKGQTNDEISFKLVKIGGPTRIAYRINIVKAKDYTISLKKDGDTSLKGLGPGDFINPDYFDEIGEDSWRIELFTPNQGNFEYNHEWNIIENKFFYDTYKEIHRLKVRFTPGKKVKERRNGFSGYYFIVCEVCHIGFDTEFISKLENGKINWENYRDFVSYEVKHVIVLPPSFYNLLKKQLERIINAGKIITMETFNPEKFDQEVGDVLSFITKNFNRISYSSREHASLIMKYKHKILRYYKINGKPKDSTNEKNREEILEKSVELYNFLQNYTETE